MNFVSRAHPNAYGPILEAAVDLLAQSGPSGMTINEICKRAGVKPPAIYYHFGSKDGLIGAAIQAVAEAWLDQLVDNLPADGTLEQRVEAALQGWQAMIESPTEPVTLLLSVQLQSADASLEIRAALQQIHTRAHDVIRSGLETSYGPIDGLTDIADTVLGLVQAAALRFHLDADRDALRARLVKLGRMLTLMFAKPSSESGLDQPTPDPNPRGNIQ